MVEFAPSESLLAVSKASRKEMADWGRGVHLQTSTGKSLRQLRERAAADRLALAATFTATGRRFASEEIAAYRSAVSRFYYGMYHSGRSVVYFHHRGDDHQEHSKMPTVLPGDFPDRDRWSNALTGARLDRNRADYDPYPKSNAAWKADALSMQSAASELLAVARNYLRTKGCQFV